MLWSVLPREGGLVFEVGCNSIHVIRVIFLGPGNVRAYVVRTSFRGAKTCKIGGVFLVMLTNFGKEVTDKSREKMKRKNAHLGFIFIAWKTCLGWVLKVLYEDDIQPEIQVPQCLILGLKVENSFPQMSASGGIRLLLSFFFCGGGGGASRGKNAYLRGQKSINSRNWLIFVILPSDGRGGGGQSPLGAATDKCTPKMVAFYRIIAPHRKSWCKISITGILINMINIT